MSALLLALGAFSAWTLFGLGALAAVDADTSSLRVVLLAPALGSCVWTLATFACSHAGASLATSAIPVTVALAVASIGVLAIRRRPVTRAALPIAGLCVAGLLLTGWPALHLGFRWLANANEDMAGYALGAAQVLHHGLLTPFSDVTGLQGGSDWSGVTVATHAWGQRPGAELLLAGTARVTGRAVYEVYMPLALTINLAAACSAGALALLSTRRRWAAAVAVGLVLVSPLFAYGALQQLLPQNWGLAITLALLAVIMRPALYGSVTARADEFVTAGLLTAGLLLAYIEILPEIVAAYGLFLFVLVIQRRMSWPGFMRIVLPGLLVAGLLLNTYLLREAVYLNDQVSHGLSREYPPLFGFVFTPAALPGLFGLQTLPVLTTAPRIDLSIVVGMVLAAGVLGASVWSVRRAFPAGIVLIVCALLAATLALNGNDFGLFKLTMYVQPLVAVAAAVGLASLRRRRVQIVAGVVLGGLVLVQLSTQLAYVRASRMPGDLPDASSAQMLPAFRRMFTAAGRPVVSVTENPFLIELEAASAETSSSPTRPLWFASRDRFRGYLPLYLAHVGGAARRRAQAALVAYPLVERSFQMGGGAVTTFDDATGASRALTSGNCAMIFTTGRQVPLNRLSYPESSPDLVERSCGTVRDLLAFTNSSRGQSFYLPDSRPGVSFNQLEPDYFFPGASMSGTGRYALFRVIGPTAGMRLELSLTQTFIHDGRNALPPATVLGTGPGPLGITGRGSARVYSQPIRPQIIAGQPYLMLDLGRDGRLAAERRHGLQGLFGGSVALDIRYLTAYARDVSLVTASQYSALRPPAAVSHFPSDLANANLQYSGLYEDGWIGEDSWLVLSGEPASDLLIKGEVPAGAGRRLQVLLDGRSVYSAAVVPGPLNVRVPVSVGAGPHRVQLHFDAAVRLASPDLRPASAHVTFLGFVKR